MTRLSQLLLLSGLAFSAVAIGADALTPAQAERARQLEQALQQGRLPAAPPAPNVLRGATLDAPPPVSTTANAPSTEDLRTRQYREQLELRTTTDMERRQLLGDQQASRLRQEMTGIPDISAPARQTGFERDQRMRDLSLRIRQQDQQYRIDGQNRR